MGFHLLDAILLRLFPDPAGFLFVLVRSILVIFVWRILPHDPLALFMLIVIVVIKSEQVSNFVEQIFFVGHGRLPQLTFQKESASVGQTHFPNGDFQGSGVGSRFPPLIKR